jgi:hypothetical protein
MGRTYSDDEIPEDFGECSSCGETLEDCERLSRENDEQKAKKR